MRCGRSTSRPTPTSIERCTSSASARPRLRRGSRKGTRAPQRRIDAGDHLRAKRDGGAQPGRLRLGSRQSRPGRRRSRDRARAPLELRSLAVHGEANRRRVRSDPDRRPGRTGPRLSGRDRAAWAGEAGCLRARLQFARDDHAGRRARCVGARARGGHGRRRLSGCAQPPGRRSAAGVRLPRLHRTQDLWPERDRSPLGP